MYPARNGDAFLLHFYGTYLLIDAGYASTYEDFIAADLKQIAEAGGRLNLVICTHIDADHIGGLLEFFSNNGVPGSRGIEVDAVWHNSLRSLPCAADAVDDPASRMVLEAIRRRGFPGSQRTSPTPISAKQGSSLAKLLRQHSYSWNSGDGTTFIGAGQTLSLPNDVDIEVVGPTSARLDDLRNLWFREVRKLGYKGASEHSDLSDDAYEMWCARAPEPSTHRAIAISAKDGERLANVYTPDTSIPNGSSIVFTVSRSEERVLFLGDAWAEDVVAKLRVPNCSVAPIIFDAIKVSHHGSFRNTSVELLTLVDSPCFLVSSDGTHHGHPNFEVLAEIVDRPASFERHLYFNYETAASKRLKSHISRSGTAFSVHIVEQDWIQIRGNHCD